MTNLQLLLALWDKLSELTHDRSGGFWLCLILIYLNYRKRRYEGELSRRELERSLKSQNETVRLLLTIFANAPRPRLKDLANDISSDYEVR